jgi:ATP-binding cassette, subfamily B, multidrug efflux pump
MANNNQYELGQAHQATARGGGRGPGRIVEKPKDFKSAMISIGRYAKRYWAYLFTGILCAVISVILQLFGPDYLSRITNMIEDGMKAGDVDTAGVTALGIKVLLFYLFSSALIYLQSFVMITATQNMMREMRTDISRKLNRMPLSKFDSASFGDVLSRVTNDVDTVGMSINMSAAELITAAVTLVGCLFMMLRTSPKLTLIAIGSAVIGFVMMKLIISKSQKYFVSRQKYIGQINGHIEEMFAGHTIVAAYNGKDESKREFDRLNKLLYESNWKSQFISGIMGPVMEFLGNFGYVAVCVLGALMVEAGEIRFGTIIAFIIYIRMFTNPLSQTAQATSNLQSAAAAAERIFSFLGETEMEDESAKTQRIEPESCEGAVSFEHVKFGYTPDKTIIRDFSCDVKPGCKVAIVGPTGSGKTTLVNLLMRFYEIDSGCIRIDGVDIRNITRDNVHELFGMVLQDTWLFEGTIKENIKYSKLDATDEDVVAACKAVGLHRFITTLPDGYDTVLTSDSSLSAGQRQLMTIARSMVEDAPLLILDEATSSVDTRTEQQVQDAMDKLTKGRTSFTIAHRLSTIRNADMIIVMKDGDIEETGTHDELLARGGFYADLWTSQFVNAEAL